MNEKHLPPSTQCLRKAAVYSTSSNTSRHVDVLLRYSAFIEWQYYMKKKGEKDGNANAIKVTTIMINDAFFKEVDNPPSE